MPRYAGIKNNSIRIVSDNKFSHGEYEVLEIPAELNDINLKELILDFKIIDGKIVKNSKSGSVKNLKIALISNYGSQCGIGTYSKFLFQELVKYVGDYKIFAEDTIYLDNSKDLLPKEKIVNCWKRGESLTKLVSEVKKYNPDIILIQHEFGLFPNARYWISMMNQLSEYRIITTMHSVFYHQDKTIVEACMPEIVVHLDGARDVLKNVKQVSAKIHVIPHGCFPCIDSSKLWNFYKTQHTVIQFGFGFRYKSFDQSIEAVYLLKKKYPDIYLTILFSENGYAKLDHQFYYNELMDLIIKLKLEENVGIIRGYQSETVLNSYLRMNRAAIFPYVSNKEHECFGSSGAAPYTMTKGIPVITSSVHHFSGLPTIKANNPEEIAGELDKLFSDQKYASEQIIKQNSYLENNSWTNTALKYISVFENK